MLTELMFTEFKWGFMFTEYLYLLTWLFVHWIQFWFQVDDNVFFYRRWYGFKVLHWSRNEWFSRIWRCSTPVHATDERDRVFCWWSGRPAVGGSSWSCKNRSCPATEGEEDRREFLKERIAARSACPSKERTIGRGPLNERMACGACPPKETTIGRGPLQEIGSHTIWIWRI